MYFLIFIIALANQPTPIRRADASTDSHTDSICPGATHFYSGKKKPYWTKTLEFKCKIGDHYFYGKKQHERTDK